MHFQIQNNQLNSGCRLHALKDRLILKRSHDNVDRVQRCEMFSLRLQGREVFNFYLVYCFGFKVNCFPRDFYSYWTHGLDDPLTL